MNLACKKMELKVRPQVTKDQLFKIIKIIQKIRKDSKDASDKRFIDGVLLTLNLLIEDKHDKFFDYLDKKLKIHKKNDECV